MVYYDSGDPVIADYDELPATAPGWYFVSSVGTFGPYKDIDAAIAAEEDACLT